MNGIIKIIWELKEESLIYNSLNNIKEYKRIIKNIIRK